MDTFTPRSMISGRIKAGREPAQMAAAEAASAVLGSENVALVYSCVQGDIWYLAAPAADVASHPSAATPLAAALPGTDHHEGDGAYLSDLANGLQAVLVKSGDSLHSFVGTPAMASRFTALEGASASHPCVGPGLPWQFPVSGSERREARLNVALTASGLLVALLAAAAWLWAAMDTNSQTELAKAMQQEQMTAWSGAAHTLEPQPYPKALADLQKAVAQAVREKGALVKFEYQNGQSTWTLNVQNRVVTGAAN
jgi:hypothetical protein